MQLFSTQLLHCNFHLHWFANSFIFAWIMQTILLLLQQCHSASHTDQKWSRNHQNYANNTPAAAILHLALIKILVYIFWIMQTILLLHWLMPICISHWSKLESISSELLVATLFGKMWLLVRSCQTVSWKAFMHDLDFMNEWTIFSSRCS